MFVPKNNRNKEHQNQYILWYDQQVLVMIQMQSLNWNF